MNGFLEQTILAARNRDAEGWMNILFVVILAAFYAIGTIVKAKSNKSKQEEDDEDQYQNEQPQRPNARIAQQLRQPQIQPSRRKVMPPEPAVRKPIIPVIKELQKFATKPLKELEDEQLVIRPKTTQAKTTLRRPLLDFNDPDALRRAILHYEILGKPLALRKPSEF